MGKRWWKTKDALELDLTEQGRFLRLQRLDPREKLAEARSLAGRAKDEMAKGDYPAYSEMLAESRALEEWAERELQGYD